MSSKVGVLFVCLGNICRSPMAEAVFRTMVQQEGLDERIRVDSAGTGDWHIGKPPHHGTRRILDEYQISYEGMKGRQVSTADFSDFDYIVAMDEANESDLRRLTGSTDANIIKLLDLIPEATDKNVPDPYYTGNFEEVYDMVDRGCRILLDMVKQELS